MLLVAVPAPGRTAHQCPTRPQFVGPGDAGPDLICLGSLDGAHRKAQPQAFGERLHAEPNTLVGDQVGGGFVHQEAVFDTL